MKETVFLIPLFLIAAYLLYENGLMTLQSKRAVSYIGALKGKRATFSSCTGQIRRVVRFRESKSYQFHFDCALSCGEVSVELFDCEKQSVLFLKNDQKQATAILEKGKRYVLVFRFQKATGQYLFEWK